jgi:hypothetical protein
MMIQVLPADNGANAGLGGAINLASGDGTPDILLTFDLVRADALPRATSRTLILEAAEQWKTR